MILQCALLLISQLPSPSLSKEDIVRQNKIERSFKRLTDLAVSNGVGRPEENGWSYAFELLAVAETRLELDFVLAQELVESYRLPIHNLTSAEARLSRARSQALLIQSELNSLSSVEERIQRLPKLVTAFREVQAEITNLRAAMASFEGVTVTIPDRIRRGINDGAKMQAERGFLNGDFILAKSTLDQGFGHWDNGEPLNAAKVLQFINIQEAENSALILKLKALVTAVTAENEAQSDPDLKIRLGNLPARLSEIESAQQKLVTPLSTAMRPKSESTSYFNPAYKTLVTNVINSELQQIESFNKTLSQTVLQSVEDGLRVINEINQILEIKDSDPLPLSLQQAQEVSNSLLTLRRRLSFILEAGVLNSDAKTALTTKLRVWDERVRTINDGYSKRFLSQDSNWRLAFDDRVNRQIQDLQQTLQTALQRFKSIDSERPTIDQSINSAWNQYLIQKATEALNKVEARRTNCPATERLP